MGSTLEEIRNFFVSLIASFGDHLKNISFGFADVIDILLVAVLFYYLLRFVQNRRAGKLALGVALLILFQILSNLFHLRATQFLMANVFQVGLIAIIVVFQPELRSVLEKVGGDSLRSIKSIGETKNAEETDRIVSDLCESVCDMSKDKTGALIVLERETRLGDVIDSGTVIDAEISPFLIRNIFFKNSPLHDGALVVRGDRLYAAGCFLPLPENPDIGKDLGTRHRAAIGMSENSDALVLIVSEETGIISVAKDGELKRNFDYSSLKRELLSVLSSGGVASSVRKGLFGKIVKTKENGKGDME